MIQPRGISPVAPALSRGLDWLGAALGDSRSRLKAGMTERVPIAARKTEFRPNRTVGACLRSEGAVLTQAVSQAKRVSASKFDLFLIFLFVLFAPAGVTQAATETVTDNESLRISVSANNGAIEGQLLSIDRRLPIVSRDRYGPYLHALFVMNSPLWVGDFSVLQEAAETVCRDSLDQLRREVQPEPTDDVNWIVVEFAWRVVEVPAAVKEAMPDYIGPSKSFPVSLPDCRHIPPGGLELDK